MIAFGIVVGIVIHAGNHLACDFPLLVNSSPEKFSLISSDFNNKKPTFKSLLISIEGITGITMVTLMTISFTLATSQFRRNAVNLPSPLNRLTGFNAFWYSHHLLGIVYVLLFLHGSFLNLTHKWYQKTVRTSATMFIGVRKLNDN
jgi:respiratory burst oxidase